MTDEIIEFLRPAGGSIIVDGTIGEGGHAALIAKKLQPGGFLIGIDKDRDNLKIAKKMLSVFDINYKLFCDSYVNVKNIIKQAGYKFVDAVLLDLGFSRRQIEYSGRGFTFLKDEKLDMRFNKDGRRIAYEWLNSAAEDEIRNVLKKFGEEKDAKQIAAKIILQRCIKKIHTTFELSSLVRTAKFKKNKSAIYKKINPATKTFQAIRIYINNELEDVNKGVEECLKIIKKGGRFAVLTYHSLEDKIVKEIFRKYSGQCLCPHNFPVCKCGVESRRPLLKIFSDFPLKPSEREITENPSARSAHLRGCEVAESVEVEGANAGISQEE